MKKFILLIIVSISVILIPSCASTRSNTRVKTVQDNDSENRSELSGKWNDADSKSTADTLIQQMLTAPWYAEALEALEDDKKPMVLIGQIKLKANEHIKTEDFINNMKTALISSRKIRFASTKANALKAEKEKQMLTATDETAKIMGKEIGADFIVFGNLSTTKDRVNGKSIQYYQVNLELHNIETGEIVWVGQKKIKKFIRQNSRTW